MADLESRLLDETQPPRNKSKPAKEAKRIIMPKRMVTGHPAGKRGFWYLLAKAEIAKRIEGESLKAPLLISHAILLHG